MRRQNATDGDILRFAYDNDIGLAASVASVIRFGLLERGLHARVPRIQVVLAKERAALGPYVSRAEMYKCVDCNGSGESGGASTCLACAGHGKVSERRTNARRIRNVGARQNLWHGFHADAEQRRAERRLTPQRKD